MQEVVKKDLSDKVNSEQGSERNEELAIPISGGKMLCFGRYKGVQEQV